MPRFTFPEWTETLKKWISLLVLGAPVYLVALVAYGVTPQALRVGYQPTQPVPYSHALHAGELGMDCRYCHSTVERAGEAAIPPASVCMNCHATVKKDSDVLLPIREAYAEGAPVAWTRVTDLPDYVYFQPPGARERGRRLRVVPRPRRSDGHGLPGPAADDGVVPRLPPRSEPHLRSFENLTKMGYEASPAERKKVLDDNRVRPPTNCSTCHR